MICLQLILMHSVELQKCNPACVSDPTFSRCPLCSTCHLPPDLFLSSSPHRSPASSTLRMTDQAVAASSHQKLTTDRATRRREH